MLSSIPPSIHLSIFHNAYPTQALRDPEIYLSALRAGGGETVEKGPMVVLHLERQCSCWYRGKKSRL